MPTNKTGKIQIGIYQIDKSLFEGKNDDEIVNTIIEFYNEKVSDNEKFSEQRITSSFDNFNVKVFFSEKIRTPKWRSFLDSILDDDSPLLKGINKDSSYIAFIYNDDNIFAISGGQGNFIVQNYIDQNFGIEILTRLISKDSKVIKSLQDRGVAGYILGSTKFFRGDYKLSDEDEFGKIYKQIKAELNQDTLLETFGFTKDEIKKEAGCLAKSSFQINKAISFEVLLRILKKINDLLKEEKIFTLNKVILIPRRGKSNKDLIKKLEAALNQKLFKYSSTGEDIDFDFCHPNFDDYLTADHFKIFKGSSKTAILESTEILDQAKDVLDSLKNKSVLSMDNDKKFHESINSLNVVSFDSDGKRKTWKKLFNHFHGEIEVDNKTYFFIDNEWYEIKDEFIKELNEDCKYYISQAINTSVLPMPFNANQIENAYNSLYFNKDKYIVLDKVILENIEFCDILKYNDDKIYLIHVKKTFDNSMRELTSQAFMSARRLAQDKKAGMSFLKELDKYVSEGKTVGSNEYSEKIKNQSMPTGGIKNIFKDKKDKDIVFCLGILDTLQEDRDLSKDITKYRSNIAKFSILELEKKLRSLGFGFVIAHVKKAD